MDLSHPLVRRHVAAGCIGIAAALLGPCSAFAQASAPIFSGRQVIGTATAKGVITLQDAASQASPLGSVASDAAIVDPEKSLMIRATSVVEDPARTFDPSTGKGSPNGAWTFGTLVRELARQDGKSADPVLFLRRVLDSWTAQAVVNGDVLDKRNVSAVQAAWQKFSGAGPLDIDKAPFRLLAIVNRVDLRSGAVGNAGEARFVFGAIDGNGAPLQFTAIFEYGVSVADFAGLQAWARRWTELSAGDAATYNARLELVTRDYTTRLGDRKDRAVAARLNQLRTNEISLGLPSRPWQLREFVIGPDGLPQPTTTKKTPQDTFATDPAARAILAQFLQQNAPVITSQGTHSVPEEFGARKLLAGKTEAPSSGFLWGPVASVPEATRRAFSLNTCNGCHAGETSTVFTHVKPRAAGAASGLSGFLTGITVTPVAGQEAASYADLERRRQDLVMLASPAAAVVEAQRAPLGATH